MQARGVTVLRGGDFERWDLHLRVGRLAGARLRMAVEEHGEGRQLLRFRMWPRWSAVTVLASLVLAALCGAAVAGGAMGPAVVSGLAAAAVVGLGVVQASTGLAVGLRAAEQLDEAGNRDPVPAAVASPEVMALEEA
jgi:O-antigen biosynthesis protein